MKKILLTSLTVLCFVMAQTAPYAHAAGAPQAQSETQILVNMLVESGVLTREQGDVFRMKAHELAEKQAKAGKGRYARKDFSGARSSGNMVDTKWENGLEFESRNGNFKGSIGGRVQADMVYVRAQSDLANLIRPQGDFDVRQDRALIRRARLYTKGTIYDNFFYKLAYDFADNVSNGEEQGFRGAYMGMKNIPYIGTVKVGQFKEPFSLEELTSSKNITFIERGLPNLFAPGYSWGAAIYNDWFDERVTLGLGAFRESTSSGSMGSSNDWNFTTRVTGLPWYEDDQHLLHVGAAYSLRFPESEGPGNNNRNRVDFDQRPELRTRDDFVNTGNFPINLENRLGLETAVVYGPFSAQAELIQTWLDDPNEFKKTGYLYGWYGYVSYFITGESRNYNKKDAEFKRVRPLNNFSIEDGTWGAWEVAARFSQLDLDDKTVDINGGILNNATLGVNWYLNPNMKIMFNYVHTNRTGKGYGWSDGIQARAQVAF